MVVGVYSEFIPAQTPAQLVRSTGGKLQPPAGTKHTHTHTHTHVEPHKLQGEGTATSQANTQQRG